MDEGLPTKLFRLGQPVLADRPGETFDDQEPFMEGGSSMKRLVTPILFTVVISFLLVAVFQRVDLTPLLASRQGQPIDALIRLLFIIASVIFALVIVFFVYSLVAFRRQPGDTEDATPVEGSTSLEIAWTVVPLIIVLGISGYSASVLFDISAPSGTEQEMEVRVTGFRWAWQFEYPELGIISSELVLPVNQPVLFRLHATDVIHSFYVPEFRLKMDTIPGRENLIRITPTKVGEFKVRCAEMCGTGHAYMQAPVKVVEGSTFQQWVKTQMSGAQAGVQRLPAGLEVPTSAPAEVGKQYAQQSGCTACHSSDGSTLVGPTWKGLFSSEVPLQDGSTPVADEDYLRRSIVDPGAQIVQGFPDVMPKNYQEQLSQEQIQAIVEYIKSLR